MSARAGRGPGEGPEPWAPEPAEWRVLVPVLRAQAATPLLQVADALSGPPHGEGVVLGMVELPRLRMPGLNRLIEERRRDLLRWIAGMGSPERPTGLTVQIRVSRDVALGVREAVYETAANVIVLEWPGLTSRRPKLVGAVLEELTADPPAGLVLVRSAREPDEAGTGAVLVAVRGGPNAQLSVQVGEAIATARQAPLTLLHVVESRHHPRRRAAMSERFRQLVAGIRYRDTEVVVRRSDSAAATIRAEAQGYRTVVLGAFADLPRTPILVRSELARMVRGLEGTLILVRQA